MIDRVYSLVTHSLGIVNHRQKFAKTGEFRKPLEGECFLSGAIPSVYFAPSDLGTEYHIMREVEEIPQIPQAKKYKWKE